MFTGHVCPWRGLTGISCPLCGGTRATAAMLHGHLLEAATFNMAAPLALLLATSNALVWITENLSGRRFIADRTWGRLWMWAGAAFLGAWLVKLVILVVSGHGDPALAS
ncbi:MAG: DUF2752 domain-containing protein [Planctomycetota bacterium]|jgi:hypothetical protein|nr:DUF2752 domain-containing protein [Planctomycetota bacterium]